MLPLHHMLASSQARMLTAFPDSHSNRLDELPIRIEGIAFEITYQELIDKHCLVPPVFEEPYQ